MDIQNRRQKSARWNGEKCQAQTGTVIVGKVEVPTWWCAGLTGQRFPCVRVDYNGEVFYLADDDGSGSHKVFETAGGPFCAGHKSLPVDDESSFIPNASRVVSEAGSVREPFGVRWRNEGFVPQIRLPSHLPCISGDKKNLE